MPCNAWAFKFQFLEAGIPLLKPCRKDIFRFSESVSLQSIPNLNVRSDVKKNISGIWILLECQVGTQH